ncbi:MAG: CoA pyrophosphatase [Pseudomonadales bacterium]|nr:CoA pyrophosphatase [Pseudomonadales bacterium]
MFTLDDFRAAVKAARVPSVSGVHCCRQAAVAVVVREGCQGLEMLFILRSEHESDPWSGQVSFPGGHVEESDINVRVAAERETFEETGLDLGDAEFLGRLPVEKTSRRDEALNLDVFPCAFGSFRRTSLRLNREVADAFWVPLESLADRRARIERTMHWDGRDVAVPGVLLPDGHWIWGLTLRVIDKLVDQLRTATTTDGWR